MRLITYCIYFIDCLAILFAQLTFASLALTAAHVCFIYFMLFWINSIDKLFVFYFILMRGIFSARLALLTSFFKESLHHDYQHASLSDALHQILCSILSLGLQNCGLGFFSMLPLMTMELRFIIFVVLVNATFYFVSSFVTYIPFN